MTKHSLFNLFAVNELEIISGDSEEIFFFFVCVFSFFIFLAIFATKLQTMLLFFV